MPRHLRILFIYLKVIIIPFNLTVYKNACLFWWMVVFMMCLEIMHSARSGELLFQPISPPTNTLLTLFVIISQSACRLNEEKKHARWWEMYVCWLNYAAVDLSVRKALCHPSHLRALLCSSLYSGGPQQAKKKKKKRPIYPLRINRVSRKPI